MAIYSANHKTIGRSTHAAGTAGAHARYVTRAGAASEVIGEHMPTGREAARAWLDEQELAGRKNARVCDKVLCALPIEMDAAQRADLVREFMQEFGGGRVSWLAGIHDRGEDAHNPHAHIIIRDKDHETGKRVFGTSEKDSTERIRLLWEQVVNRALEREGIDARVTRLSLKDQGLAREPGIHVGPNVQAMEERGIRPESFAQDHTTSRGKERVVNWPEIDQGRTRADRQREIEAMNADLERGGSKKRGEAGAIGQAAAPPQMDELHQLDQDGPPEDRWGPSPEYEDQSTREPDHEAAAAATATTKAKQPEPENPREDLHVKNLSPDPMAETQQKTQPANQNTRHRHNPHVAGTHREVLDAYEALRRTDPVTAARLFGEEQRPTLDRGAARQAIRDAMDAQQDLALKLEQESQANQRARIEWAAAQADNAAQDAYRAAHGQREELGGARVAEATPEATQRRSYESEKKPEAKPTPENAPRDTFTDRLAWATMLRNLDTADRVRDAAQQGYRAAQGTRDDIRPDRKPEATRQPEKPAYDPAADRAAIEADRRRVQEFADRLEAAFTRYRDKQLKRQAAEEQKSNSEELRRILNPYRHAWGREWEGPEL